MLRDTIMANSGSLGLILMAGVIILVLFIVLRFFRMIFSLSFVGFLGSIVSYMVWDYIWLDKIPLVAALSFLMCVSGFTRSGVIGKIFAFLGTLLSGYIILHTFGLF